MTARVSRPLLHLLIAACFVFLGARIAAAQTQVTLEPVKDNTLYESATGDLSNGAGQHFFAGRSNQQTGSIRRALLAFDVAGNIPSNATITSASLTLEMTQTSSGSQTVSLHRVNADWGEGTSVGAGNEGGGGTSTPGDATWLHRFFDTTLWSAAGGDFSATASASLAVGTLGVYTWGSTGGMVADVQHWVDNPSTNFGWLIRGNESIAATSKRFNSRNHLDTLTRPELVITYTTTASVEEVHLNTFALHQNYPNPFNPTTTMRFHLPSRSHATLRVFNILGQQVATVVDAVLPAGSHAFQWNASLLSSGVYVYRLEANGFVAARRLVLAR